MKTRYLASIVLLLLWVATGCRREEPASGQGPATVRVAYAPVVLNVPLFVAQDRGHFAKAQINLQTNVLTSANNMTDMMLAGQVDAITGVSLVPVLNLEAQRPGTLRVVMHSRMTDAEPFDGILVKDASALRSLNDLVGRKIGVFPGTTARNWLTALLKRRGIDTAKVEIIPLPPASQLSALQSGTVDALLAYEPTLTIALQQGGYRRIHGSIYAALLDPSPISSVVIARRFEKEQPEVARRFVRVLDDAVKAVRADPKAARFSLTNHTQIAPAVVPHVNLIADATSAEVNAKNLQQFIDLLVEMGELPRKLNAEDLLAPAKP